MSVPLLLENDIKKKTTTAILSRHNIDSIVQPVYHRDDVCWLMWVMGGGFGGCELL